MQALRGAREIPLLGHSHEITQVPKFHGNTF
jgi:hypothetical protein